MSTEPLTSVEGPQGTQRLPADPLRPHGTRHGAGTEQAFGKDLSAEEFVCEELALGNASWIGTEIL